MKRGIGFWACLGLALAPALSACRQAPEAPVTASADQAGEAVWLAAPRILSVTPQSGGGVLVRGEAAPGARVVLSGGTGAVMAASADASGRFELPVVADAIGQVLTPEIQIGQASTPGPQRLLLAGEPARLAALLTDGGASLRLTPGPALDALDGDGRGLLATGRAEPGRRVEIRAGGGVAEALADADGRWVAVVPVIGDQAAVVEAAGRAFRYPGPGPSINRAERAGEGWRVTRVLSGVARQTTWFPDAEGKHDETALTSH